MIRTEYGYLVTLQTQVLISGDWGSDDCNWDWKMNDHHFLDRDEAEKFFKKSKKLFKDGSVDRVAMYHYEMDFIGDTMICGGLGDPIKEYIFEDGKVVVNEDL